MRRPAFCSRARNSARAAAGLAPPNSATKREDALAATFRKLCRMRAEPAVQRIGGEHLDACVEEPAQRVSRVHSAMQCPIHNAALDLGCPMEYEVQIERLFGLEAEVVGALGDAAGPTRLSSDVLRRHRVVSRFKPACGNRPRISSSSASLNGRGTPHRLPTVEQSFAG